MIDKAIIELAQPEPSPTITHLKICAWNFEVPRDDLGKPGKIDIWLARCYVDTGAYVESTGLGVNIIIEGAEFDELISLPTTVQDLLTDTTEILSNFLIDKGYIEGVVIHIDGS